MNEPAPGAVSASGGMTSDGWAARLVALEARFSAPMQLLAGAGAALALPPFGLWPAALLFGAVMLRLRAARSLSGAIAGLWPFFFARHLAALYWVGVAFYADAERFGPWAVPAVLAMCAGLALFDAIIAGALWARRWRSLLGLALALAAAMIAGELLRALAIRFPWNPLALIWDPSLWMLQSLAWIGPWLLGGLSAIALFGLAALLPAPPADGLRRNAAPRPIAPIAAAAAPLILAALWAGGGARLALADPDDLADLPALQLRVVQPNIAQHHKWDPEQRRAWFFRHVEVALSPPAEPGQPPTELVIWPESAAPYPLDVSPDARLAVASATPPGAITLLGSDRFADGVLTNSLFALDDEGAIVDRYDKVDLVPFGEFLPFRAILGRLGLEALAIGSSDFQPGPGRETLDLPLQRTILPMICYEAVFARPIDAPMADATLLVNITNDAWFGDTSGPHQHLGMARMRAIERGAPMARAANTGVSAVFDGYGRELARLPLEESGVIDIAAPPPLARPTIYAEFAWQLCSIVLVSAFAIGARSERVGQS